MSRPATAAHHPGLPTSARRRHRGRAAGGFQRAAGRRQGPGRPKLHKWPNSGRAAVKETTPMKQRDYQDIAGGLLLTAIGVFVALYSNQYDMGTPARMGPGFFPRILGWLLAALGVLIAVPAFFRRGQGIQVQWGNALFVLGAIVLFAFLLRPAGILVATTLAAFVASMADKEISWKGRVYVSLGVAAVTWLVFIFGLSMRLPLWPAFLGS